jgi:hypothetical protein
MYQRSNPSRLTTAQPMGVGCACAKNHRPAVIVYENHEGIWVCPTTHDTIHIYLELFGSAGRVVLRGELKKLLADKGLPGEIVNYTFNVAVKSFKGALSSQSCSG